MICLLSSSYGLCFGIGYNLYRLIGKFRNDKKDGEHTGGWILLRTQGIVVLILRDLYWLLYRYAEYKGTVDGRRLKKCAWDVAFGLEIIFVIKTNYPASVHITYSRRRKICAHFLLIFFSIWWIWALLYEKINLCPLLISIWVTSSSWRKYPSPH